MNDDKQESADKIVGSSDLLGVCQHDWVSNSGKSGEPRFKPGLFKDEPVMHVLCSKCGDRTWFTEDQWEALE